MQSSDLDKVCEIEKKSQTHPWNLQQFKESLDSYQCTVIEKNKQVVGFCILQPVLDEANLLLMAIASEYQGQGLGFDLLENSIYRLGSDCVQIFLEVRQSNQAAIALYEKSNFHQIDLRPNYYPVADGGREHAVIMVKSTNDNIFNFKLD